MNLFVDFQMFHDAMLQLDTDGKYLFSEIQYVQTDVWPLGPNIQISAQLLVCAFISPDLNRDVLISQLFNNNNNKKTPKTLWFNESWQKVNTLHMLPLCKRDTCEIPTWQAAITIDFHLTAAILQTVWFMLCEVILKTTSTTRACTCAKVDIIENLAIKHDLAWYDIIYACFS